MPATYSMDDIASNACDDALGFWQTRSGAPYSPWSYMAVKFDLEEVLEDLGGALDAEEVESPRLCVEGLGNEGPLASFPPAISLSASPAASLSASPAVSLSDLSGSPDVSCPPSPASIASLSSLPPSASPTPSPAWTPPHSSLVDQGSSSGHLHPPLLTHSAGASPPIPLDNLAA